ncbi:MAG: PEP-CTERM sorting domain-containing protein, partial [Planctomycetes bacterium]|nr:PEP-CTERM sorting domain-containing protein [Planctomycetota bacterium]
VVIRNGGYWYTDYGTQVVLGRSAGSHGVVNMSGGDWMVRGAVYIGSGGAGTVNLTGGTMTVEADGDLIFGGQGKFILDGGTLDLQSSEQLPDPDTFEFRSGTLSVRYEAYWADAVVNDACTLSLYHSRLGVDTLTATAGSTVTVGELSGLHVYSNGFASFQNAVSLHPTSRITLSEGAQLSHTVHTLELNGATVSGQGPGGQVVVGQAGVNLGTSAAPGRLEGQEIWEPLDPEGYEWELVGYEPLVLYGDVFGCGTLTGVTVYGNVHVGNEPGGLTLAYVDLGCATVGMEVGAPLAGPDGLVICEGDTTFASAGVRVTFAGGYEPERGDAFQLFSTAEGEDLAAMLAGCLLSLPENCSLDTSSGTMVFAPEPSTLALLAAAGLWLLRRRRG